MHGYKLDLKTPSLLEIPAYTKLPESLDSVIAEQDESPIIPMSN
jgi:hypothetical protein